MKIFITGVSSGIGRETVKLLTSQGHEVWGVARRAELLQSLAAELNSSRFFYSKCDVTNKEDIETTIQLMVGKNFLPDAVVLNSAVFPKDLQGEFHYEAFRQTFNTNVLGALIWVEKFLPKFLERGSGKFVAIASTSAFRPDPASASLPASKAALAMAIRGLRLRYEKQGVKFTIVYFGPVATDIVPEFRDTRGLGKLLVMKPQAAAKKLNKAIFGKKNDYFFPFFSTWLFRLSLIFPDRLFSAVTKKLKK